MLFLSSSSKPSTSYTIHYSGFVDVGVGGGGSVDGDCGFNIHDEMRDGKKKERNRLQQLEKFKKTTHVKREK